MRNRNENQNNEWKREVYNRHILYFRRRVQFLGSRDRESIDQLHRSFPHLNRSRPPNIKGPNSYASTIIATIDQESRTLGQHRNIRVTIS